MSVRAALALAMAAGAAHAAPDAAQTPTPALGDRWVYRTLDAYTGLPLGEDALTFVRRDTAGPVYRHVDLRTGEEDFKQMTDTLGECVRNTLDQLGCGGPYAFPLVVGQKTGYARRPTRDVAGYDSMNCTVAATETLRVPAGSFETYRIECSGLWRYATSEGSWQGKNVHTFWYAPAVNAPVKVFFGTYTHYGTPSDRETRELVSFTPGTR